MYPLRLGVGSGRRLVGGQQIRALRIYLAAISFLYGAGVAFTLFPVRENVTLSNPVGGIVAISLGVSSLVYLAVRPDKPLPAVMAAILATPIVMAFHRLIV